MKEVKKEDLIHGKEYYLECLTTDKNNEFVPHYPPYKMIARFDKLDIVGKESNYKFAYFENFRKIEFKKDKNVGYNVNLNIFWRFYEIIQDKIQSDMERRAYNMVLQEVVKDEYFRLEFL
jgi:hypothetical protein